MKLGRLARSFLGPAVFRAVAKTYRALFVDLDKVIDSFPPPPDGAVILDIGGGDGALIELFLRRHQNARATMIDTASSVGLMISDDIVDRVERLPATTIDGYAAQGRPVPDVILLSDVIHHVPPSERASFFLSLSRLVAGKSALLIVKEVEPHARGARVALFADRYVSGERNVEFIAADDLVTLVTAAIPGLSFRKTELIRIDPPNYSIIFETMGTGERRRL